MFDEKLGILERIESMDKSKPRILFIDHKDVEYERKDSEEIDLALKWIQDYKIDNYVIYFTRPGFDDFAAKEILLKENPNFVVLFGTAIFKALKLDYNKKYNQIKEYTLFAKEVDGRNTLYYPVINTISPWSLLLHEYDENRKKIMMDGLTKISKTNKILLDHSPEKITELEEERKVQKENLDKFMQVINKYSLSNPEIVENLKNSPEYKSVYKRYYELGIQIDRSKREINTDIIRSEAFGTQDTTAVSEIITNYKDFEEFCKREIDDNQIIAFDVETNALEKMDIKHRIIGFSLASNGDRGCYVPFESIDFNMEKEDREKVTNKLKDILQNKTIMVYNSQHEIPVVYNNYNIFMEDVYDLYVMVKLLNCGKKWENGNRSLKYQVSTILNYNSWDEDLHEYRSLFLKLNKPENVVRMKLILSKYYEGEELETVLNQVVERYEKLKEDGTLASGVFLGYEQAPYKLMGKYGSLDSSMLFLLRAYYEEEVENLNQLHTPDLQKFYENENKKFDLNNGFRLWSKIHTAHIIMEMNGFYFNDKKAEKLNKWIDEKVISIMDYFVKSPLLSDWIKTKGFYYDFSRNYLMMNCIDDLIDSELEAKVLPGKNAITKDHIKFYKPTKRFIETLEMLNQSYLKSYNECIANEVNLDNRSALRDFFKRRTDLACLEDYSKPQEKQGTIYRIGKIFQGKPAQYFKFELSKDGIIIKIDWQQLLLLYFLCSDIYDDNLIDDRYKVWIEERLRNVKTFEDYKELFNVNATTKDFRGVISDILLSDFDIRLGHTYYKFYELYESADYSDLLERIQYPGKRNAQGIFEPDPSRGETDIYKFLKKFEELIESSQDAEVFSTERLELFKELYEIAKDDLIGERYKYHQRKIKECLEWVYDPNSKLPSLDSKTLEHLTQLYGMLKCNVDDPTTWTESFEFMFNYKLIKKLLKAKSTYIYGSTSRANARYVSKYYYKDGHKFPRRLLDYEYGNDINEIYDLDEAIEIELENGITKRLNPGREIELVDGTKKLAKDLQPDDDIILEDIKQEVLEEDEEDEINTEELVINDKE